jgi:hypothetical protein
MPMGQFKSKLGLLAFTVLLGYYSTSEKFAFIMEQQVWVSQTFVELIDSKIKPKLLGVLS